MSPLFYGRFASLSQPRSLAAVFRAPGELAFEERPVPVPGPGEVLIEVGACAICGSDLHQFDGHMGRAKFPVVPGHEIMGRVRALGEGVEGVELGARACIENHIHCGACPLCLSGRVNLCQRPQTLGVTRDGAYSQHLTAPAGCVIPLPDALDDATGAIMQTLGTGYHAVMARARLQAGETAVIMGMGPVGLCALAVAKYAGARCIVTDTVPERLEAARKMGADEALNPLEVDAVAAVRELTGGAGADAALEVVGGMQEETIRQAVEMIRWGGRAVVVGQFGLAPPVPLGELQDQEKDLIGSRGHPHTFEVCIELAAAGALNVSPMITHRIPLTEAGRGMRLMRERTEGAIKVVITPNGAA